MIMKKILVLGLMLAMAAPFGGASVALADSSTDSLCGPDAPEGYKRPGGYCDQIDSKGSLFEQNDGCDYYTPSIELLAATLKPGERLLVADNCVELDKK
jgi:hypothetical protein